MGKGAGNCHMRSALSFAEAEQVHTSIEENIPGKSRRAKESFKLLQEAGDFTTQYLLRDLSNPQKQIGHEQADGPEMVHNAFMEWIPSSYRGHSGHVEEHEQIGQELFYTVLLDGDRRSSHIFFWHDSIMNGVWTNGSAASARGWYGLPHDGEEGYLDPQQLKSHIQAALDNPKGSFLKSLRKDPIYTIAQSVDIHETEISREDFQPHFSLQSEKCQKYIQDALNESQEMPKVALKHLKFKHALKLSSKAQLSQMDKDLLLQAVALAPDWQENPQEAIAKTDNPKLQALLQEITPTSSIDDYPMYKPKSKLGKLLADVQQGWMASKWCDWGIYQYCNNKNLDDTPQSLDFMNTIIKRSPCYSTEGRQLFMSNKRTQDSRLRALIGLAQGGRKLPSAKKETNLKAK